MKKLFSYLFILLTAVMIVIPIGVKRVNAAEKVKVYVFEAGGCGWCAKQIEYLEGLESYGETFEVIRKELYVDNVSWEPGEDYYLGSDLADAFSAIGFENASISGTPFVVISDLYASASYSEDLESIIEEAYEEGDKDVVGCFERGENNCLPEPESDGTEIITAITLCVLTAGVIVLIVVSRLKTDEQDVYELAERDYDNSVEIEEKQIEEEPVKEEKKTSTKKETAKKESTKKTTSKSKKANGSKKTNSKKK